jgi:GNAT superfamily N-acetyltransferase
VSDRGYGLPTVPATFRRATPADAAPIARLVIDGFETYRSFTPPGWEPPAIETELGYLEHLLPDEHVWVLLAEEDGRLVGQVSILPSVRHVHPEPDPSLAHFRNLFVAQDHWGTGLATTLHAASIEEARDRGFEQMRLFTPAEHGRARRFYEREGWTQRAEPFDEPRLGMALVEYRFALA